MKAHAPVWRMQRARRRPRQRRAKQPVEACPAACVCRARGARECGPRPARPRPWRARRRASRARCSAWRARAGARHSSRRGRHPRRRAGLRLREVRYNEPVKLVGLWAGFVQLDGALREGADELAHRGLAGGTKSATALRQSQHQVALVELVAQAARLAEQAGIPHGGGDGLLQLLQRPLLIARVPGEHAVREQLRELVRRDTLVDETWSHGAGFQAHRQHGRVHHKAAVARNSSQS